LIKIDGLENDGKAREREYQRQHTAAGWCCDRLSRIGEKCWACGKKDEKMPSVRQVFRQKNAAANRVRDKVRDYPRLRKSEKPKP